ncbi:response regulator [Actinomyces sp. oral taxon 448]|jgi:response regulator receiver protein|uniref:response regulator n=1 Tax=Actinomyces sp. oral taxon 448 TaxID=712124 RepID=UPI0002189D2C|nr:response regulator transcription factor [Actinomyces sp. oral taxon 448]EGQ75424.1 LuxR family response regulator [Actinomyces sp. oral taxon 448 str. F0400]
MNSLTTPDPDRIGVVLVDDDAMALTCLESYFDPVEDIRILLATRSARQMMEALESSRVDVLITDVHMESMDGMKVAREVLRVSPGTRVILLTTVDTDDTLIQGLSAGASGFLLKSAPAEEILSAVRTVHSGAKVVAPMSTARLIDYVLASAHTEDGSVTFSDRERDVLHMLCEGASNRRIASRLSISEATVKSHVSVLLQKTGTRSRLEIVVWAFRHGYAATGRTA